MQPNEFTGMLSVYRPPLVFELTGRRFTLAFDDGYDRELYFKDRGTLSFGTAGEEKEYAYECLKGADRCYFVNFEDPAETPRLGITLILDLAQDLVTMALARTGVNPKIPGMPSVDFVFGAVVREDGSVSEVRHGYTPDLAGKAISWYYGRFEILHVYATEHYYRVSFTPRGFARSLRGRPDMSRGAVRRTPSPDDVYEDYLTVIRIRDRVYAACLLETVKARVLGRGNSLLVLMDLDGMHNVGRSFGSNDEGGTGNNTFGAFGVFQDARAVLSQKSTLYTR